MYYAVNTAHDLNFVLRERREDLSAVGGNVSADAAADAMALSTTGGITPASSTSRCVFEFCVFTRFGFNTGSCELHDKN